ncbi:hypothetical protein ACJRO7_022914 [Eucalyptus globulus]|uniref:F-box/kelch-repeat protein n=1 Tax=Eucalyptus globulus TaxID=34317 RepID=A0ABD3K0M0_EUCGL
MAGQPDRQQLPCRRGWLLRLRGRLLSVEVYNTRAHTWSAYNSMPAPLRDSSASLWLSVGQRMYIMKTLTGTTHAFDPDMGAWLNPYELRSDRDVFYSVTKFAGDRLIMGVKVWGSMVVGADELEEICTMPKGLVKELQDKNYYVSSIDMCSSKDFLYMYSYSPNLMYRYRKSLLEHMPIDET